MTFDERKQECIKRGIVPGVTVRCAFVGQLFTVPDLGMWEATEAGGIWTTDSFCMYNVRSDRYAEVITAAPEDEVTRLRERVQKLEGALEGIMELRYSSRISQAIDEARAILNKTTNTPDQP